MTAPAKTTVLALACSVCGTSCPPGGEQDVKVLQLESPAGQLIKETRVPLTWCQSCAERRSLAASIIAAHPAMAGQLGTARVDGLVEGLLTALHVLDRPLPAASITDDDLGLLLRHLGQLWQVLAWRAVVTAEGQADPFPFAHVTDADRARLRAAYAALLAERVARSSPSIRLRPPDGQPPMPGVQLGGCLLCGLGAVTMPAAQVARLGGRQAAEREAWSAITVDPHAIGGRRSPDRLSGFVCPECADAVDSVGAVGQTAMAKALTAHLLAVGRNDDAQRLRTADPVLVGWGALGQPANTEPWGHLLLLSG